MSVRESFDVEGVLAVYRPVGEATLVEAVDLTRAAIARSRQYGLHALLVTARGLHGMPIPTLVDRFLAVEEWAEAADSMLVVALVVHPQYIHPRKFGVKVAADFGLTMDVFTSETNARAWLTSKV